MFQKAEAAQNTTLDPRRNCIRPGDLLQCVERHNDRIRPMTRGPFHGNGRCVSHVGRLDGLFLTKSDQCHPPNARLRRENQVIDGPCLLGAVVASGEQFSLR
ncbi:MAG: hypothetical protein B6D36_02475 [Planctomycetes bacterium UTPLA1]|nr:MAG: hypothetical protein B6D36_02475 [Planctomycetes bacterium UTPLA1]